MKIEIYYDPVFHIVIRNVFNKKTSKDILDEMIANKNDFIEAGVSNENIIDKSIRNNKSAYYDNIYSGRRNESVLLKNIDSLFSNKDIRNMLLSSPYPLSEFPLTTTHETQVSSYGNINKYDWHVDSMGSNNRRKLTFVYYVHSEPKKYSGGNIELSDSPIDASLNLLAKNPNIKSIEPENNMGIFFGANTVHRVSKTKSPKSFKNTRFSVNCWIGNI